MEDKKYIMFTLNDYIYATMFCEDYVLLNLNSSNYLSIIDHHATWLNIILSKRFYFENNEFYLENYTDEDITQLNKYIKLFLESSIIKENIDYDKVAQISTPKKQGGMSNYSWRIYNDPAPFHSVFKKDFWLCIYYLCKFQKYVKNNNIKNYLNTIYELVKKTDLEKFYTPNKIELSQLAKILDLACMFFNFESKCLLRALVLQFLSLKRKWKTNLVIGVQKYPFFAHAWIKTEKYTVHDSNELNDYMGILLNVPFQMDS